MTAAARKLEKQIDTTLKKVSDGIQEFAEVWDEATNSTQSQSKLGEELKKSINKLQRWRVQIRDWLANEKIDTKYTEKLEDTRKRIEYDMQRFKDFEREIKTKAFSTLALSKEEDEDLETSEKRKNQEWICNQLQVIGDQVDEFEADLERLLATSRKDDVSEEEKRLRVLEERHRWHIKKLEQILRSIDHGTVDFGDFAVVKEHVEYYIENGIDDENFPHDELLYDCLDLIEFPETAVEKPIPNREEDEEVPASRKAKGKKEKKKKETKAKPKDEAAPAIRTKSKDDIIEPKDAIVEPEEKEVKVQEDQLLTDAEEFICKICYVHVVGMGPKLTNCSHLFCGDCLNEWFNTHPECQSWAQRAKTAGMERIVPCPVCKQRLNEKTDLHPVSSTASRSDNLLLWRMLSSLKIMCINHTNLDAKKNCDWIGEYGTYQEHAKLCINLDDAGIDDRGDRPSCASPSASVPASSTSPSGQSKPVAKTVIGASPAVKGAVAAVTPVTPVLKAKPADKALPAIGLPVQASGLPPKVITAVTKTPLEKEPKASGKVPETREKTVPHTPIGAPKAVADGSVESPEEHRAKAVSVVTPSVSPTSATEPVSTDPLDSRTMDDGEPWDIATPILGPAVPAQTTPTTSVVPAPVVPVSPLPATAVRPPLPATPVHERSPGINGSIGAFADPSMVGVVANGVTAFAGKDLTKSKLQPFVGRATVWFGVRETENRDDLVQISAECGDLLQVLERHVTGWTFAKNLTRDTIGWVPSWLVPDARDSAAEVLERQSFSQNVDLEYILNSNGEASTVMCPI